MAIDKKLRLGGMENSPPKADQSSNRFKVANNVTFNNEGYLTPRCSMSGFTPNSVAGQTIKRWTLFSSYKSVVDGKNYPLKLGIAADNNLFYFRHLFLNNALVETNNGLGSLGPVVDTPNGSTSLNYINNFSDQCVQVNNTAYILSSPSRSDCKLIKYDGEEACTAGIGSPYFVPVAGSQFPSVEPPYSTQVGSRYVKVIGHSLDMQGNQVTSDPITYRTTGNNVGFNAMASGTDPQGRKILVGVGEAGICYSYNGIDWDANVRYDFEGTDARNSFGAVVYGNSLFVALNNSTSVTQYPVWISSDGITWRRVTDISLGSIGGGWSSIAWNGSRFVAVRSAGGATAQQRIMWSSNGVAWQYSTTVGFTETWRSIAWGNAANVFVAINNSGPTTARQVATSTNGEVWTFRTIPTVLDWRSVVFGGSPINLFVAVAASGTTATNIITSPDGITWTSRTSPATNMWTSVTFGINVVTSTSYFVAVCSNASTANKIMYSTNGTTWTGATGPNTQAHNAVTFFNPSNTTSYYFIAGAAVNPNTSSTKMAMSALDTAITTWTEQDTPITTKLSMSRNSTDVNTFREQTQNSPYFDAGDMTPYFYGTATYNAGFDEYVFTTITGADFFGLDSFGGNVYVIRLVYFSVSGATGGNYGAIAYKRTASDRFSKTIKAYNLTTGSWDTFDGSTLPISNGTFAAGRRFYTVWASPSLQGVYYYKGLITAAKDNLTGFISNIIYTIDIAFTNIANKVQNVAQLPFSISSTLNDWYDLNTTKNSFNDSEVYKNPYVAITIYQDLLLLADKNIIYFSDYTNGGSLEMTPSQFLLVGDSQYGNITSIVGTKDYLIVSRERKVYLVAGNITTANIRVQEIPDIPVGAYSNTSLIEIYGTVFMMSSSGAWLINGANSKKISDPIALNFKTFMANSLPNFSSAEQLSVGLNMNSYPTTAYEYPSDLTNYQAKYLLSTFDSFKSKVIITNGDYTRGGQSLVYHLSNGEWTTYDAYESINITCVSAMSCVDSILYVGTTSITPQLISAKTSQESIANYTYNYVNQSPSKLVTTWMTQGEPSLEKLLLQIKIFGYILGKLDIKHYINWDYNTEITNTTYTSPGNYVMFHKQRLNSSKPMAAAIELIMNSTGNQAFWIEGIEVEFEPIQQGMKR